MIGCGGAQAGGRQIGDVETARADEGDSKVKEIAKGLVGFCVFTNGVATPLAAEHVHGRRAVLVAPRK